MEDREGRKIVKAREDGRLQESGVFWTQQGGCTEELPLGMTASARPVQAEADEIPARKREAQSPPPGEALRAIDRHWERES